MAYNLGERFPPPPTAFKLLDPGAYQSGDDHKILVPNKVPFLSSTPRKTQPGGKSWTDTIYNVSTQHNIPNITSMTSKCPRFPYEALSKEDLELLLCRCGFQSSCECPTGEEEEKEVLCQARVRKRIFIGTVPRSSTGGLSVPSKRDHGFEIQPDGSQKRLLNKVKNESPPFYDATVHESTAFYHGCKWSHWTSKRTSKPLERRPGPADYQFENKLTDYEKCAEYFRFHRRKTSKQLRFIEMVQERNIIEGRPGPATYSPMLPKPYDNLQCTGSRAKRFITNFTVHPGPADHFIKRAFDLPEPPEIPCHAKLPVPPCFGMKDKRFKPRREEGPSPATYHPNYNRCHFMHCPTVPFGSSTARFKNVPIDEDDEELEPIAENENEENALKKPCPRPTWEFKSKTVRMKPLKKKYFEPSPADLPQSRTEVHRLRRLQNIAPFFTSEGRFEPWHDWMPVWGTVETPGSCYYSLEIPKCYPAVKLGPLSRTRRFPDNSNDNPPPNIYKCGGGIETILATHNQKLKNNIENQHKFVWVPPMNPNQLSNEEKQRKLLHDTIRLLGTTMDDPNLKDVESIKSLRNMYPEQERTNPKMLRCFVYGTQTPHCI